MSSLDIRAAARARVVVIVIQPTVIVGQHVP
jgi:hypothetical protein